MLFDSLQIETVFLCPRQCRLAGGIMFSMCPSVRPSVRPFISKVVNTIFCKRMNRVCCKFGTNGPRGSGTKRSTLEVKGQGHTAPRHEHYSRPIRSTVSGQNATGHISKCHKRVNTEYRTKALSDDHLFLNFFLNIFLLMCYIVTQ